MVRRTFFYCKEWEIENQNSGLSDQQRTTREFVLAMSSLVSFLTFEGEDHTMFLNSRLPTLDCEIWVDETSNMVKYSFFEKAMCPNRLVQKSTALSQNCIRASLCQDVVRRLKKCSLDLPNSEKQEILSKFSQKIVNLGHSVQSVQYILVHGVVKFVEMVKNSNLPKNHPKYWPLHCEKDFNVVDRKLKKNVAKNSWFEYSPLNKKLEWRQAVPRGLIGARADRVKLPGMDYSTVMKVPSSKGGRLLRALAAAEPRLAKSSKYEV